MATSDAARKRARDAFRKEVEKSLAKADQAFQGEYADEMNGLLGLSKEDIDAITPGVTDLQTYDALITVVKEASRVNLAQADLAAHIKSMGAIAVSIANKVPALAALLA